MTNERYIRTLYVAWKLALHNHYAAACALSGHAGRHCAKVSPHIIDECSKAMAGFDRMPWVHIMDIA